MCFVIIKQHLCNMHLIHNRSDHVIAILISVLLLLLLWRLIAFYLSILFFYTLYSCKCVLLNLLTYYNPATLYRHDNQPFAVEHQAQWYKTLLCNTPASCHNRWQCVDKRTVTNRSQERHSTPEGCALLAVHQKVGVARQMASAITFRQISSV